MDALPCEWLGFSCLGGSDVFVSSADWVIVYIQVVVAEPKLRASLHHHFDFDFLKVLFNFLSTVTSDRDSVNCQ
jgi:hypothetical protein